jgi:hypothetical protein
MKFKIALAAFACSGTLLAIPPTSASAAPVSGIGQAHSAELDNPLLQKVHRWWRRGWGPGPYYGYGYGYGYPYYRPYYPAYRAYSYGGYYPPPPPPPYYYYRPYWGPYY